MAFTQIRERRGKAPISSPWTPLWSVSGASAASLKPYFGKAGRARLVLPERWGTSESMPSAGK